MNKLQKLKENSLKPIGTVFEYEGVKVVIIGCNGDECSKCHFNANILETECYEVMCADDLRPDNTCTYYKEVKNNS